MPKVRFIKIVVFFVTAATLAEALAVRQPLAATPQQDQPLTFASRQRVAPLMLAPYTKGAKRSADLPGFTKCGLTNSVSLHAGRKLCPLADCNLNLSSPDPAAAASLFSLHCLLTV